MVGFDSIVSEATQLGGTRRKRRKRRETSYSLIMRAINEQGIDADDTVGVVRHVMRMRGFESPGFDAMSDAEVGRLIKGVSYITQQLRKVRRDHQVEGKGADA